MQKDDWEHFPIAFLFCSKLQGVIWNQEYNPLYFLNNLMIFFKIFSEKYSIFGIY